MNHASGHDHKLRHVIMHACVRACGTEGKMIMSSSELKGCRILATERIANSRNGNPRFRVVAMDADGTTWIKLTSSDASCSYDVDNIAGEHRRDGSLTVTLGLTRAGRISTMTREAGEP